MPQQKTKKSPEQKIADGDHGRVFFSWRFAEATPHERRRSWYIWALIVVALLLLYSFLSGNLLFAIIVVIIFLTTLLSQRNHDQIEFKITEDGIVVNDKLFEYQTLKHFYIIYQPPAVKTLYFEPKSLLKPRIPIPLLDQNPVEIRQVLIEHLEEDIDQENEPISDQFSRLLKL